MKTAALPQGFPVGRLRLSKTLPRAISGRATGYVGKLPPMISPLGGQAPARGHGSTQESDVSKIRARGKGTLSEILSAKATEKNVTQDRSPSMHHGESLPPDGGANVNKGTGQVRDAMPEGGLKAASARQLLRERLASIRV